MFSTRNAAMLSVAGAINDEEFADGLYDHFDDNDDGYVSDAEWEDGIMVDDYGDNGFWDM